MTPTETPEKSYAEYLNKHGEMDILPLVDVAVDVYGIAVEALVCGAAIKDSPKLAHALAAFIKDTLTETPRYTPERPPLEALRDDCEREWPIYSAQVESVIHYAIHLEQRVKEYEENMRLYITDLCMGPEHQAVDWVKVFSELLPAPTDED